MRDITAQLPGIIAAGDALAAQALALRCAADNAWLPEALMLLNTAGLTAPQQVKMMTAIFGVSAPAAPFARIGALGFSFPLWRFAAQGFDGESLLARFGMEKLKRANDLRNAALPDPARDEFGTGFIWRQDDLYVEYRRAYLAFADKDAALIVRNNSYYYGRDRLPEAAYVSFNPPAALEDLQADDLQNLMPLQKIFSGAPEISVAEKQRRLTALLSKADDFDLRFSRWLFEGDVLEKFVTARNAAAQALPVIAAIEPALPPWFPRYVLTAGADFAALKETAQREGLKLALLSGVKGDLPT